MTTEYGRLKKFTLWGDSIRTTKALNDLTRKAFGTAAPFSLGKIARTMHCYFSVLDDVAEESWRNFSSTSVDKDKSFSTHWRNAFIDGSDVELRKRGLVWKDSDRDLLLSVYAMARGVGDLATSPTPPQWLNIDTKIRKSRLQERSCKERLVGQTFNRVDWVSDHKDAFYFEDCTFVDCDMSNASFASSVFSKCTFVRVLLINARFRATAFDSCRFEDIDLSGAILGESRFWFKNYFDNVKVNASTQVDFPLLEEQELSYELATRNYGLFKDWYAKAGISGRRSECAYREKYCLSQTLPLSRERGYQNISRLFTGYNEKPQRLAIALGMTIVTFGFLYHQFMLKGAEKISLTQGIYFSVVTFTTLGFGDITPSNFIGQALVAIEVVIGVLGAAYLTALLIRRLI